MVEIKELFKTRLDKALEYREIKPADLARLSGISESTISQYRSGYSKPKDERLVLIANVLHVDPSWLMGLDVPMVPRPSEEKDEELADKKIRNQKVLDLLAQLTDEELDELISYTRYLISKRKPS